MGTCYNFCAGPAVIPDEVIEEARSALRDWGDKGYSVMGMSHRSDEFAEIAATAESDLRELMAIPENYHVLFMQGGATAQFSIVPMNLLRGTGTADYICTGVWSEKAAIEAKRYCNVNVAANGAQNGYVDIPEFERWNLNPQAAYVHLASNETINGVEFQELPDVGNIPIVSDMSSNILSQPIDVSKHGLIYAGAQKNIGPSGITVVIVRDDLLGGALSTTPSVFNYTQLSKDHSLYNTPPTFAWFMSGLVFKWLKKQGGTEAIATINQRKAKKIYEQIDSSDFYENKVSKLYRSRMNIPFTMKNGEYEKFISLSEENGLFNLSGWRRSGGLRASIYNAMPEAGVDALVEFMAEFERKFG